MSRILLGPLRVGAGAVAAFAAAGCQLSHPMPAVDAPREVSVAAGEPVAFRVDAGPLDAAGAAPVGTLTLAEAVRLTVRNDPRIQAALWHAREAQAEALQTRLLPNPLLSVAVRVPSSGSAIIEASITQELASLLSRPARITAADARLRAAAAEAVTVTLDVLAELRGQVVAVQAVEALVPVFEERRAVANRLLGVARARLEAGEGTRADVLAVEGQAVELEVEIVERQRDARSARLMVARLLGRPSDAATWSVEPMEESSDAIAAEPVGIAAALDRRPEGAAAWWELAALGGDLRAARLVPFDGLEAGADSERDDRWSVGPAVAVPVPLFDWGQAARAKATAGVAGAGHRLTAARRLAVMEVRQAFADRTASADVLRRVRDQLIPVATRRREQAEDAYRSGLSGLAELLLADQELQSARVKAIESERRLAESEIRLERAAGGPAHVPAPTTFPATRTTGTNP